MSSTNVYSQEFKITTRERNQLNKHNSLLLFFTGLSGSGKSTIANALEQKLFQKSIRTFSLDGDNVRKGINSDLDFTEEHRKENIRRIAHICKLFVDAGLVVLASFIAPFQKDREFIKEIVGVNNFFEIYINTPLSECERRDIKGLYKRARSGEIENFTGISSPYEKPTAPNIIIDTSSLSIEQSVEKIYTLIQEKLSIENE